MVRVLWLYNRTWTNLEGHHDNWEDNDPSKQHLGQRVDLKVQYPNLKMVLTIQQNVSKET